MDANHDCLLDIIVVTYQQDACLRGLINSLQAQTVSDWRMFVLHDGPSKEFEHLMEYEYSNDSRIKWLCSRDRHNDWGHTLRKYGLNHIGNSKYVLITNGDNYYTPVFIQEMCLDTSKDFIMCDFVHNQLDYAVRIGKLGMGSIDVGSFVVRTDMAKKVGWTDTKHSADWTYAYAVSQHCKRFKEVRKVLFVHN